MLYTVALSGGSGTAANLKSAYEWLMLNTDRRRSVCPCQNPSGPFVFLLAAWIEIIIIQNKKKQISSHSHVVFEQNASVKQTFGRF